MDRRKTLLILDDAESSPDNLSELLSDTYNILEVKDADAALGLIRNHLARLCMILINIAAPHLNGLNLLRNLRTEGILEKAPAIAVTDSISSVDCQTALELGAADVILIPFEPYVVLQRIRNLRELYAHKLNLESLVEKQTKELRRQTASLSRQAEKLNQLNHVVIDTLSTVIEYRNLESGQHIKRMRMFTHVLLETLTRLYPRYGLTPRDIEMISSAAVMHDIGKIAIPDEVLLKPARLTPEEFEVMKTHTVKGCEILKSLEDVEDEVYLGYCFDICRWHHEKWDGKGYPDGLAGDRIPVSAQVVSLVDCYDALTSARVYKPALSHDEAVRMILDGACGMFSMHLLECFRQTLSTLQKLGQQYADGASSPLPISASPIPYEGDDLLVPAGSAAERLRQFVQGLFSIYLEKRDINTLRNLLDDDVSWFGTGLDEVCHNLCHAMDLLDLESASGGRGLKITGSWNESAKLASGLWLSRGELDLSPQESGQGDLHLRFSMICRETEGSFKVLHIHISLPNEDQAEGEYMPKRITREYNRTLQKSLEAANGELAAKSKELQMLTGAIPGGVIRCVYDSLLTIEYASAGMLELFGYSRGELLTTFGNSYARMVYLPDLEGLRKSMNEQLAKSDLLETVYRGVHRNGSTIWVMNKGRLTTDKGGRKYLTCVLLDITETRQAQEAIRINEERYRIVTEQSEDVIFDYDIASGTILHTSAFEKKFGYAAPGEGFPASFLNAGIIYGEDTGVFQNLIVDTIQYKKYYACEIRILKSDGSYGWCRVEISPILGGDGNPVRLVGKTTDIDHEKRERDALITQAQRDLLTGLYNPTAAKKRIEEFLSDAGKHSHHALFMIDIDNFKTINDTMGHLFGDAVLSETAALLLKLSRSSDILGRIGGDEFLLLLKDINNESTAASKAAEITEALRQSFVGKGTKCEVSASVGAAMYPEHGNNYLDLFRHVDQAMYRAKQMGRDRFCFWASGSQADLPEPPNIREDDHKNGQKSFADNISDYIFRIFYETKNVYEAVEGVLTLIGKYFNVSRAYVFENSDDNTHCSNTFEWCNKDVTPQIQDLQNLAYEDLNGYLDLYDENGVFFCQDVSSMADDFSRRLLQQQNIMSMLHVAIITEGQQKGYIGFDTCGEKLFPTQDSIETLKMVACILGTFLTKRRTQDRLINSMRGSQFIMDNLAMWVYVININTYELLFINKRTQELAPRSKIGELCYKAFHNRETPCKACPMAGLDYGQATNSMRIHNQYLNVWTDAIACRMPWVDGTDVCLMSCAEAPKHPENGKEPNGTEPDC